MDTIINDVKILLQNFDRDGDPEPLAKIADIFEQMAPDIAEHKDILQLRVIIDFNLQRWARSRDSLIKLVRKTPTDPNQFRDLANLNFRLGEFTAVIDSLREYFRLTSDASETRPYHAMSAALHAVGRGDEAIDFLDDAVRRLPALAIYRDENFPERQQAALDRTLPPVFLNTLLKSASMYIATRLEVGLNLPRCYMTQAVLSGDRIIPSWLDLFAKGGAVCQEHLPARPDILAALTEAGIERIVVHTRDPRQSMISGIHHHAGMFANGSFEATVFVTRLPRDYTQWDFAEQADHYLAHRFEQEVRWVADWRKTVREGQFPGRVLLTNYETFRQDNQAISRPFWPSTISRSKCLIGAKSRPHPKKARYTTAAARP